MNLDFNGKGDFIRCRPRHKPIRSNAITPYKKIEQIIRIGTRIIILPGRIEHQPGRTIPEQLVREGLETAVAQVVHIVHDVQIHIRQGHIAVQQNGVRQGGVANHRVTAAYDRDIRPSVLERKCSGHFFHQIQGVPVVLPFPVSHIDGEPQYLFTPVRMGHRSVCGVCLLHNRLVRHGQFRCRSLITIRFHLQHNDIADREISLEANRQLVILGTASLIVGMGRCRCRKRSIDIAADCRVPDSGDGSSFTQGYMHGLLCRPRVQEPRHHQFRSGLSEIVRNLILAGNGRQKGYEYQKPFHTQKLLV